MILFTKALRSLIRNLIVVMTLVLVASCAKDELPIPKHDPGEIITASVEMKSDYRYQIFFSLEANKVVSQNLKTDWDLGFEPTTEGYRIKLNSSKAMFSYNTQKSEFASVTDTSGFARGKKYDSPSGNLDLTGIGNWKANATVYIIDRGYTESGQKVGFVKLLIESVSDSKYKIRFANIDGTGNSTFEVLKDSTYNFSFFSFSNGGKQVKVEPPKSTWDLQFTQYLEALSTPYLVTGVLINYHNTYAKMDSLVSFSDIKYESIVNGEISSNIDAIGYSWKKYDYGASSYIIYPKMNYIVKSNKGIYYKLHFIDFYDSNGNKGNPKFEFQKL